MSRLKTDAIRNVNASVDGITLDTSGNVAIPNELQLADKIVHTGDTDTSIRFPSSNTITFDTGGSKRIELDSSGNLLINATTTFAAATKLQVRGASSAISDGGQIFDIATTAVATGGTRLAFGVNEDNYSWIRSYESAVGPRDLVFAGSGELLRITSDGKIGIGTTAPPDKLNVVGAVRINQSAALDHLCNAGTMLEVRGDAIGSGVTDYDFFKGFKIALNDGSEWGGQAQFSVGRWQENGTNARSSLMISLGHGAQSSVSDADSDIMLLTSDGQVRIEDGNLKIGTAGHGIDFSATADTAGKTNELLDDYEEGTFTPAINNAYSSITYSAQNGLYVKIGRIVHCTIGIAMTAATAEGPQIRITGLPFTTNSSNYSSGGITYCDLNSSFVDTDPYISGNTTEIRFYKKGTGSTVTGASTNITSEKWLGVGITYQV